ncbi:MAG: hypothetical protein F6J95_007680 [Leptolyngbya sp. SIO1E4]|nr:hypothetical protein [Leptolyngbya sp. SIO1E4]
MSKRVFLTLPDVVYEDLERWADAQGRPVANLGAFLIETAIRNAKASGEYQGAKKEGDRDD